jgi:hypothetical protein
MRIIFLALILFFYSPNAISCEIDIDILQGKTLKESIVVIRINEKRYEKTLKIDKTTESQIFDWAEKTFSEECNEAL